MDSIQKMIDDGVEFVKNYLIENLRRNVLRITLVDNFGISTTHNYTLMVDKILDYSTEPKENIDEIAVWMVDDNIWGLIKGINITEISVV